MENETQMDSPKLDARFEVFTAALTSETLVPYHTA
jgi:hypothetical protein